MDTQTITHPIMLAAQREKTQIVRRFIDLDKSLMGTKDEHGACLLHYISDKELFKEIVEFDPTLLQCQPKEYGEYPIHSCINRFSQTFVRWVLEQDLSQLHLQDNYGSFPIHTACGRFCGRHRNQEFFSILDWMVDQDGSLLRVKDEYGQTPLHRVIESDFSLAKSWIEKDPELVFEKDKEGGMPTHYVSHNEESTEFLLWIYEKFPQLIEEKAPYRGFPIHRAAEGGSLELVDYLLEKTPAKSIRNY